MLLEFSLANFRSFHKEQTLSLLATKDHLLPHNVWEQDNLRLLKSVALFGANASGKSALIHALEVMKTLVRDSATRMNVDDALPGIVPFRLSKQTQAEPSAFEVVVQLNGKRYTYGFKATSEKVHEEWLMVASMGARSHTWFERRGGKDEWVFGGALKKHGNLLKERTRDNALILSTASRENVTDIHDLYGFFSTMLWIYDLSGDIDGLISQSMEVCNNKPILLEQVKEFLKVADVGIDDLSIDFQILDNAPEDAPESIKMLFKMGQEKHPELKLRQSRIRTSRSLIDSDEAIEFAFKDESQGTQRYFALIALLLTALEKGWTLVLDELDSSLHPTLTKKIVQLFQHPEWNKTGAQLIFSTHDINLFHRDLLRRDQIWLLEKNHATTECYSLADFQAKPRNTEAFAKNYLSGRYGGIPHLGAEFENLDILPEMVGGSKTE